MRITFLAEGKMRWAYLVWFEIGPHDCKTRALNLATPRPQSHAYEKATLGNDCADFPMTLRYRSLSLTFYIICHIQTKQTLSK